MENNKNSDFIDIKGTLAQYLSKWYLFVISVAVCGILAVLFVKMRQPTYGVRANVLIQVDDTNPLTGMGAIGDLIGSKGIVDDEVFVISSHSLLRDVVKELGINQMNYVKRGLLKRVNAYPENPVNVVTPAGLVDTLSVGISFKVRVNDKGLVSVKAKAKRETIAEVKDQKFPVTLHTIYGDFTLQPTEYFVAGEPLNDNITFAGYHAVAEDLALDVKASIASKKSNAIELAIDTKNATLGENILNEIITLYNQRGVHEKRLQGEQTSEFIKDRLALIRTDLDNAELAIERYKRDNNMTNLALDIEYNAEKKGELEKNLLSAETNAEMIRITRDFLKNPDNAYSLIPNTISALQAPINSYNTLVLQYMELTQSARPNNSMLRQLTEQIDALRANIMESADRAQVNADLSVREIRANVDQTNSRLSSIPEQERAYYLLLREKKVRENLYTFLLQRSEETSIFLANALPKGSIVDEAYTLNKPLGLSNMMILALAVFFGLCIPPVYLFVRHLLRSRFDSREDVERVVEAPILGEMCTVNPDDCKGPLCVGNGMSSSASELFRLIRTNLQFMLNGSRDKVVLMTSSRSGEGKSFISINLAASLALLQKKKVLLVGMDIRKPQLANYLGIAPTPGLTEYLSTEGMPIESIIRHDVVMKNMDVIVAGPVPPNPAELLASEHVDELFARLREMYDYIIIDSAPVGMVSDTFSLNRLADASIFVTRVNHSLISDLEYINKIYEEKRLNKLSVVINGTKSKQGYGYGYK